MQRPIGFSTGALAFGDFSRALKMLRHYGLIAVELSALRQRELAPLVMSITELDLSQFSYIAVHAPSSVDDDAEEHVVKYLLQLASKNWPIIVHPDAIHDYTLWRKFGDLLCIENMDKRKAIGRTADELAVVFEKLPDASLCFDLGHARQVDATMTEAYLLLKRFGSKLRQVHVSDVNTCSRHDRLSFSAIGAFRLIAEFIPEHIPVIIEAVIEEAEIRNEITRVEEALSASVYVA